MSESGIAIDPHSKTVLLVGADIIRSLMTYAEGVYTLKDFNLIAKTLVQHSGAHYGAFLDGVTDDEWCLATVTHEDSLLLTSYLKDPRAEVAMMVTQHELNPNKPISQTLH